MSPKRWRLLTLTMCALMLLDIDYALGQVGVPLLIPVASKTWYWSICTGLLLSLGLLVSIRNFLSFSGLLCYVLASDQLGWCARTALENNLRGVSPLQGNVSHITGSFGFLLFGWLMIVAGLQPGKGEDDR